ncbi:hypothetical protein BJV74DRAFT_198466 [Russula compacta]|nr:hypothetical protein BJV74DRAFT_198466 [Russula compacta]
MPHGAFVMRRNFSGSTYTFICGSAAPRCIFVRISVALCTPVLMHSAVGRVCIIRLRKGPRLSQARVMTPFSALYVLELALRCLSVPVSTAPESMFFTQHPLLTAPTVILEYTSQAVRFRNPNHTTRSGMEAPWHRHWSELIPFSYRLAQHFKQDWWWEQINRMVQVLPVVAQRSTFSEFGHHSLGPKGVNASPTTQCPSNSCSQNRSRVLRLQDKKISSIPVSDLIQGWHERENQANEDNAFDESWRRWRADGK